MAQLGFDIALVCRLLFLEQAERRVCIARILCNRLRGGLHRFLLRGPRRLVHKAAKLVALRSRGRPGGIGLLRRSVFLQMRRNRHGLFLRGKAQLIYKRGVQHFAVRHISGIRVGVHAKRAAGANVRLFLVLHSALRHGPVAQININAAALAAGLSIESVHLVFLRVITAHFLFHFGKQRFLARRILCGGAGGLPLGLALFALARQLGRKLGPLFLGRVRPLRKIPVNIQRGAPGEEHCAHHQQHQQHNVRARAAEQCQQRPAEHSAQRAAAKAPWGFAALVQNFHSFRKG